MPTRWRSRLDWSKHEIVNLLKMHWITWSSRFSWLYKSWIMPGQNHQRKNSSRQKCRNSCCQGKAWKFRSSSNVDFPKTKLFGNSRFSENLDLRTKSISRKLLSSEKVDFPKIKIFGKVDFSKIYILGKSRFSENLDLRKKSISRKLRSSEKSISRKNRLFRK